MNLTCSSCGAKLDRKHGETSVRCTYCGSATEIDEPRPAPEVAPAAVQRVYVVVPPTTTYTRSSSPNFLIWGLVAGPILLSFIVHAISSAASRSRAAAAAAAAQVSAIQQANVAAQAQSTPAATTPAATPAAVTAHPVYAPIHPIPAPRGPMMPARDPHFHR